MASLFLSAKMFIKLSIKNMLTKINCKHCIVGKHVLIGGSYIVSLNKYNTTSLSSAIVRHSEGTEQSDRKCGDLMIICQINVVGI